MVMLQLVFFNKGELKFMADEKTFPMTAEGKESWNKNLKIYV